MTQPPPTARIRSLDDSLLRQVVAHAGDGHVGVLRIFDRGDFRGPIHFVEYAVVPPGASIGRHTHGADEELYLVLEGTGTMHVDGHDFRVAPGTVVLNRAGGTHELRNDSSAPIRLYVIEVGLGPAARGPTDGTEHERD